MVAYLFIDVLIAGVDEMQNLNRCPRLNTKFIFAQNYFFILFLVLNKSSKQHITIKKIDFLKELLM